MKLNQLIKIVSHVKKAIKSNTNAELNTAATNVSIIRMQNMFVFVYSDLCYEGTAKYCSHCLGILSTTHGNWKPTHGNSRLKELPTA